MRLMRMAVVVGGLSLLAGAAVAQNTMILGAKIGGTYSTMSIDVTDAKPGYRSSVHGGAIIGMTIGEKFAVEGQGLYVVKGFASDAATGVNVDLTMNYVDLPVALTWTPLGRDAMLAPRIFAGVSFGFRVGCSATAATAPVVDCDPQSVKDFDLGVMGGLGLKIGRGVGGLILDVTYTHGLVDAAKTPSASFKNRAFTASIGYIFAII